MLVSSHLKVNVIYQLSRWEAIFSSKSKSEISIMNNMREKEEWVSCVVLHQKHQQRVFRASALTYCKRYTTLPHRMHFKSRSFTEQLKRLMLYCKTLSYGYFKKSTMEQQLFAFLTSVLLYICSSIPVWFFLRYYYSWRIVLEVPWYKKEQLQWQRHFLTCSFTIDWRLKPYLY